jgi:two-component system nitrogen regulation sensor histidine kinase NtrY
VNAEVAIPVESPRPRWRRRIAILARRSSLIAWIETGVALVLAGTIIASYLIVSSHAGAETLVTPLLGATLLVANLVPAMVLMVLFASRLALRRATRSPTGGRGRLHVRLVVLFSVLASVPTLLVVIFASFLFQSNIEFWFAGRARGMLENATSIAASSYREELDRVNRETVTMVGDLTRELGQISADSPQFAEYLAGQLYYRNLSEAILFRETPDHRVISLALVNPYDRPLEQAIRAEQLQQLSGGRASIAFQDSDRIASLARFPGSTDMFVYGARVMEPRVIAQLNARAAVLADYHALQERSRTLQLRFNAILLVVSLLIVALAIWVALKLADRLVRPVGELVDAARRVTAGDLSARVPESKVRDEVGTLGDAFNRMTRRLEEQTGDLVAANAQLDTRRAFTEAVLSGVTAGVISVDKDHVVRLINSSAEGLLRTGGKSLVGQKLADIAPELDRQLTAEEREDVVQLTAGGEPRTLAVKTVQVERRLRAHLRRHHRAIARPAPRRLVRRRPAHRP